MYIRHLGLNIKEKVSNHINKTTYLSAKPEGMRGWKEEHYPKQKLRADFNYDLNMMFFNSLDYKKFDEYLLKKCKKFKLKECFDLNELDHVEGVYIMVLDEFKQVYIGISSDIKKRIRTHWNSSKSLERLIFGDICNSILSIDSFGALDTTRVFYIKTYSTYQVEEKIVKDFDSKYMLNRTAGGIGSADTYTDNSMSAKMAVSGNMKKRDLTQYVDVNHLKAIVSERDFQYYLDRYPTLNK